MHAQALVVAEGFQEQWDSELRLFRHDCRHHTEALVALLMGCKSPGLSLLPPEGRVQRQL